MFDAASRLAVCVLVLALFCARASCQDDAYLAYLKAAPEFKPVKHDPAVLVGRWDNWIYMPWRYQWTIGEGDEGGQFCKDYGFNGGFSDHGEGPLEWLDKWQLKFYNDHTASKGFLHLRGAQQEENFRKDLAGVLDSMKVSISAERSLLRAGFIAVRGSIRLNCTLDEAFKSAVRDAEIEVARMLFGE